MLVINHVMDYLYQWNMVCIIMVHGDLTFVLLLYLMMPTQTKNEDHLELV